MNATTSTTTITSVTLKDCDVVCGRGGLANKHSGNRMLRRICCENKTLYQASMNPANKQCLILSIIMAIQQHGGRFVGRTMTGWEDGWEEISNKKAKEKIAQLLRESEAPIIHHTTSNKRMAMAAPKHHTTSNKRMVMAAPKPVIKKAHYHQQRQQMFDTGSNNDCLQMTQEAPVRQPMLIPPEPLTVNAQYILDPVPSDSFAEFLMDALPALLPAAPRAPSVRLFDDDDLFDLIPLDADHDGMENNPEFQNMCFGLVAALSV